jgi:2-polyprenyl-3-methyl-5-hydroxy-6-metoxy-1,4-benzoquinol methylase
MYDTIKTMDPLGKKELLDFYDRHLKDFGDRPEAVRWTPEGQRRRFETLLAMAGDVSEKTILDFGCGKGDFFGFLEENGVMARYCGIDINKNLISLAKSKFPQAEFLAMDIDDVEITRTFDTIFICGVFNLRIAGIEESVKDILMKLFRMCREGLYVNFLSYYVPQRTVELFYVKPEEILQFILNKISRSVALRHIKEDVFLSIYKSQEYS